MWRKEWFAYVKNIREKEQRKLKKTKGKDAKVSHRSAMAKASESWPAYKLKMQKKMARCKKNIAKQTSDTKDEIVQ